MYKVRSPRPPNMENRPSTRWLPALVGIGAGLVVLYLWQALPFFRASTLPVGFVGAALLALAVYLAQIARRTWETRLVSQVRRANQRLQVEISERKQAQDALQKNLRREEAIGRIRDHIIAMREFPELRSEFENNWVEELRTLGIPVNDVSLQLPAPQPGYFVNGWAILLGEDNPKAYPVADFVWLQEAWESREPVVMAPEAFVGKHVKSTTHSLVEIPLTGGGSVGLNSTVSDAFDPETVRILQVFAELLAEGLHRVQDFEALRNAEGELQKAHDELEQRVEDRTVDLQAANERLQVLANQLQQSNRELEDFAYVSSHDLQEPLRKIQAFGDRLVSKESDSLSEGGIDYLRRMQDAARRMQNLIGDLLSFSRIATKAQPFVWVDLNQVCREVVSDLEVRLEETDGRVEVGDLPSINGDPTQMRQVLQNLVGNALKFCREGVAPLVEVRGVVEAEVCQLTVEDNGIGFDEKYLDRIFSPFQRLHGRSEYEGTGMGLAICRKIVERHGGQITARSTPGQGSIFVVALPVEQPKGEQAS